MFGFAEDVRKAEKEAKFVAAEAKADAAAKAARGRWSGGPVQGGQSYTVNELGKEMFMHGGPMEEYMVVVSGTASEFTEAGPDGPVGTYHFWVFFP